MVHRNSTTDTKGVFVNKENFTKNSMLYRNGMTDFLAVLHGIGTLGHITTYIYRHNLYIIK